MWTVWQVTRNWMIHVSYYNHSTMWPFHEYVCTMCMLQKPNGELSYYTRNKMHVRWFSFNALYGSNEMRICSQVHGLHEGRVTKGYSQLGRQSCACWHMEKFLHAYLGCLSVVLLQCWRWMPYLFAVACYNFIAYLQPEKVCVDVSTNGEKCWVNNTKMVHVRF